MAFAARWIRSASVGACDLRAACVGFALAQSASAAPVVFWARTSAPVVGDPCDIEERHFAFVMIAPLRLAPGRRTRWRAWAMAPALATYRHFGLRAYLDDDAICLNGRRIGESHAQAIGACAVVGSSFMPRPPGMRAEWPERDLEGALRARIEAQHGWQFENSWPSKIERLAIDDALVDASADAK